MTWSKGEPWRVVRSLDRLNQQVRVAFPRAVPPATPVTSWGAIADDAHNSSSDHYPHYYSVLGSTAVVCARDFPHAPTLGLDAHALADRLRLSRDPRIGYIISDRRITGPAHGWRWDPYDEEDPHDTHIHVSTVHTAAADDPRDWQIGDDMTPEDLLKATIRNPITGKDATVATFLVSINSEAYKARLTAEAALAAVKGVDDEGIKALIRDQAAADATRDAKLAELVQQANSGELAAEAFMRKVSEMFADAAGAPQG